MQNRHPAPLMLVDDEPANLLAMEAVLEGLGEPLVRASSGHEAMRLLRDRDFAAVLLDLHMPGMDGIETARLIRAQRRSRETPILFITADASEMSQREAYSLGAVDFIVKPFRTEPLLAKLGFFIELHRSRAELHEAERQAVQDRVFLSAVLEAVEDGIVACDPEGHLTLVNRAAREFLGLPPAGLPRERWPRTEIFRRPDGTPVGDRGLPLRRALDGERVNAVEVLLQSPDAPARPVLASGQALHDEQNRKLGAVVSLHDISAWREAESARETAAAEQIRREDAEAAAALLRESREKLAESEKRYRTLFESIDQGFCIIEMIFDADGRPVDYRFLETNPAFEGQTGLSNAVGRTMRELAPDLEEHWYQLYGAVARTGEPVRFEQEARPLGRWYDVYAVRLEGGRDDRVAILFSDITARRESEQSLRRLASELAESDRRKTEFLATLAHELRNPLAPISNGLHLLRRAQDAQMQERAREMMERQLRHMVHLVDDLLDIARISSNKVDLRMENLDLASVLAGAVETSSPLITAAGHNLDVKLPQRPLKVHGDATRIAQVVSNLLNNAAKYTPPGGRIELDVREEGGAAVIRVTDTGMGIPPTELPKVFEMFTQVGRNLDRAQGGLGIGLALVKRLVELHGGSVEARSEGIARGSTFIVRLPLASSATETAPHTPDTDDAGPASSFRVLVVDDNVDAAESLAALLAIEGHEVQVAHDGESALLTAARFHPRVVFLDIGMPGKDGYQVAREMRAKPDLQDVTLVALTGWGAQEDRARSRDAGFDHHLTKPAGLASVQALLSHIAGENAHAEAGVA